MMRGLARTALRAPRLPVRAAVPAVSSAAIRVRGAVIVPAFATWLAACLAPCCAAVDALAAGSAPASVASGISAGSAVPSPGFGAVLQTLFALAVVIGIVFGCAWLARRFGLPTLQRSSVVRSVGGASLGGKERVAVVEVGGTWLVLGVAPGNVRVLHTLAAPTAATPAVAPADAPAAGEPSPVSFSQRFRDALRDEAGKRLGRRARRRPAGPMPSPRHRAD